jgi:uncharacterized damage-inducible protein DinB
MDYSNLIEQYSAGPDELRRAVAGMTDEQLDAKPIEEKWSTRQVVAHIADFEPIYVDRMKRVIAENQPTLFAGNPDVFAASLWYERRDIEVELELIAAARNHMNRLLRWADPEDFQRTGKHSESGPITLAQLLQNITNHIPHHIRFIEEKRKALRSGGRALE